MVEKQSPNLSWSHRGELISALVKEKTVKKTYVIQYTDSFSKPNNKLKLN